MAQAYESPLIGILLMSLGSPNHLDEMEEYLLNIRNGRPTPKEFIEEIKGRYRAAGGRSPLLEITNRQAQKLEKQLNQGKNFFKVVVGMRHWHPYIESVMKQMAADGIREMISLPMTPYDSSLSMGAYHDKVKESEKNLQTGMQINFVKAWYNHPLLIQSFAERIEESLTRLKQINVSPELLFTAHSLPERILKENDPYPEQLQTTASLVAQKAGISNWHFAYQSQGGSKEPWLGPTVEQMLERFQKTHVRHVLIAPIGFVSDHMEILYDIDILFKAVAKEKGIGLARTASLNDSPAFIRALEAVALQTLNVSSSFVSHA